VYLVSIDRGSYVRSCVYEYVYRSVVAYLRISKVSNYISSPQELVRYSKPFNNQCRSELGLPGILFHKLSTKNL